MVSHQFHPAVLAAPISLWVILIIAITYLLFTRPRTNTIKLPIADDNSLQERERTPEIGKRKYLDVDIEVKTERFYPKLRLKKLVTLIVLLSLVGVNIFKFCWSATQSGNGSTLIEDAMLVIFWVNRNEHMLHPNDTDHVSSHSRLSLLFWKD